MSQIRLPLLASLRMLCIAASLLVSAAHADEYADVSQLVRSGKLQEALTKVDQYLGAKPRDPQMRFLKALIQQDSGQREAAITSYTALIQDYPELPEPYNNVAVLYAGNGQLEKARDALEMATRNSRSYATAHENLGDVYARLAEQSYRQALQLDAGNSGVPPKLALIRELFSPTGAKAQRPATLPAAPPPAAAPVAAKPVPSLPGPVVSKGPAPVSATATASSIPASAPAAPASATTPTKAPVTASVPSAVTNSAKDAEAAVHAWAQAWSAKDVKSYLASYGKDFNPPGSQSRSSWEEERRQRISSKSKISVKLENLKVTVSGNTATAKFRQDYKANGLAVSSRKTLDLVKHGDRWQIVKESTGT
jgi:tetratricopeptide (TPR) repeat protein